ncbi:MAG TPA: hypothetical protein VMW77_05355 [Methanoregula sp.]|nr:hypothetical protein [Methanoregula sp.]
MTGYSRTAKYAGGILFVMLCAVFILPSSAAITLTPGDTGSSSAIANGDPVDIRGVATGHPQNGLQVWVIGYNYVKIDIVQVNADNTYSYELKSSDTQNLASGQYLVIIQHPMMNGQHDIVYDPGTGGVINRQLGEGMVIFQLTGPGSLQRPDAGSALMQAINNQNIDDSFTTVSFFVSRPTARINPIGEHFVGDKFTIAGSTNLAVGDTLMIEIYSSSFKPTQKVQGSEFSGSTGTLKVMPGADGYNRWSFDIDASTFRPDEYTVKVSGITLEVTGSTTFTIVEKLPTTLKTPAPATTLPAVSPPPTTLPAPASTTQKSPLSLLGITCAIALVACARTITKK